MSFDLSSNARGAFAAAGLVLLLAGCAPSTLAPRDGSPNSTSPTTGGPLSGTPSPDLPRNNAPTAPGTVYACDTGETVRVEYPDATTALVHYDGQDRTMHAAVSADGARYVGDRYEWWTRGSGPDGQGTLYEHADDNSTGRALLHCNEQG